MVKVLACTHRSYCHTLGKQQDLLYSPGRTTSVLVLYRKSWTSRLNVQGTGVAGSVCKVNDTAQETGDRKDVGFLNTERKCHFFPPLKYIWPFFS